MTVRGATDAALEVSAPGPTIYNLSNTFTNQFGSERDANGGDSGSTAWINLPGTSGTKSLDPVALGIPSSLNYQVRVVATHHGQPVGQASPSSALEVDDGVTPDGSQVTNFDINPGGASTVATATVGPNGAPAGSSLSTYDPASGKYGPAYAHDASGDDVYFLYGSDPGAHRMMAAAYPWAGTEQHVLTYDTTDRHQVADQSIDLNSQYNILAGRVDPQRHRADLLAWRGGDQADVILPVDTTTGVPGTPVVADNGTPGAHFYTMLDVEQASGKVDLGGSFAGDLCVIRRAGLHHGRRRRGNRRTDVGHQPVPDRDRVRPGRSRRRHGRAVLLLPDAARRPGCSRWTSRPASVGELQDLGARSPIFPTVDTVHGLLVVGFLGGTDWQTNNNGMSGVGVYDLHTGAQLSFTERFNLFSAYSGLVGEFTTLQGERGIQLDPSTRTGWTYAPYGNEVQQFHY